MLPLFATKPNGFVEVLQRRCRIRAVPSDPQHMRVSLAELDPENETVG
jgi:hypothetical protein